MDNTIIVHERSLEDQKDILYHAKVHSDNISESYLNEEGMIPVTEAYKSLEEVPLLKIQKRLILPFDSKDPLKGNVIILNTTSLEDSIRIINHPIFYGPKRYLKYFIDYRYRVRILNKQFISNNKKNRIPIYAEIVDKTELSGLNAINNASGKNLFFDMYKYNELYRKRESLTKNISLKISTILTIMKNVINDERLSEYKKTMIIDANSWVSKKGVDKELVQRNFDNILYIFYYLMLKDPDSFKSLGDIAILIVGKTRAFKINPSKYVEDQALLYKRLLNRVLPSPIIPDDKLESDITFAEIKNTVKTDVANFKEKYAFTGEDEVVDLDQEEANEKPEEEDEILQIIDKKESKLETENKTPDDLESEILNDEDLVKEINAVREKHATGRSTASLKRDEVLRKKQAEIKLNGIRIEEVDKIPREEISIPVHDVSKKVNTTNKNITKIAFPNIEKTYIKKMYKNDIIRIIKSLNDKDIGIYILDIKTEDTSDELNLKETWTVKLEDENRQRHTLKFDMPIFIDDKFVFLGGNKKVIIHQQMMKPVVKTSNNTVQLVSSEYNRKIFVTRYETKSTSDVESFIKAIEKCTDKNLKIKRGNSIKVNANYDTFYEYDEISKHYQELSYKMNHGMEVHFMFNQDEVHKKLEELKTDTKKNADNFNMCIGFTIDKNNHWDSLWINTNEQTIGDMSICKYIASLLGNQVDTAFTSTKVGKRAVYSQAVIMKKRVPIILLLSYLEGLSTVLRKANVKYQFLDKRPRENVFVNQTIVKFADGFLVYENVPFNIALLLNGLNSLHTELYEFSEFDDKDVYYDIIETLYGRKNLATAFDQFYEWFIGPITKEVLDDYNYPTSFCELILFANNLLADNKYISEMNYNNVRIRSSEIVVTFLYEALAGAYFDYKRTAYSNNPTKLFIPQDKILKDVMTNQIVENYSKLNPMVEAEKFHTCTPKGPSGMNLSDAFTIEKRAYDPSMVGVISMSTSPDANCGVSRTLAIEPKIINARGYLDLHEDDLNSLHDTNLFGPAEMLSPLGASRDDAIRTSMAVKQSKHVVPVEKSAPVLISNGSEQVIQYHLSNDFVVTAEEDGVVKEIDEKQGIIVLEYQPKGEPNYYKAINIGKTIDKNGAGGFYLSNRLESKLKADQKFKKDDILAYDSKFFSDTLMGNKFNIGSLQKVACMQEYSTFEDSTCITKKASEDMATEVTMPVTVVIGRNASVSKIVKEGDHVLVGDELIVFENSFEEDSLNKLLGNIGDELKEEVKSIGKIPIKAKYSGVIEGIELYSGSDLEDLSPSLRKIVSDYWKSIREKKNVLNKYDKSNNVYKCGLLLNKPDHKIETRDGKIKGEKVDDGVMITFYIKYKDIVGIADKVTQ